MKLKLSLGLLFLAFLVAFSCTTKKPSKFKEVTVFRGRVTQASQPVENALVELKWSRSQNCICKPGNVIECAAESLIVTDQPTNASGDYSMEIDWNLLGFLFDESSPCQMKFYIAVFPEPNFDTAAVDSIYLSIQDRSVDQIVNFQIP